MTAGTKKHHCPEKFRVETKHTHSQQDSICSLRRNLIRVVFVIGFGLLIFLSLFLQFGKSFWDLFEENSVGWKCPASVLSRFDCMPEANANPTDCLSRDCCWDPVNNAAHNLKSRSIGIPACFYPSDFPVYNIKNLTSTKFGENLTISKAEKSAYPKDLNTLSVSVFHEEPYRLRIKIFDPKQARYEVPIETPPVKQKSPVSNYQITYGVESSKKFTISVKRKSTNTVVFDTDVGRLIFADQFLQISTKLASSFVYGIGEHRDPLLHSTNWTRFVFWNRDHQPLEDANLYGSHPFYMVMENDGNSHGVFLLNSNAMEMIIQPTPAITFRSTGGIFDFYIFLGPSPADVVRQYQAVIGVPAMVPYWALGFHLCRWGYGSSTNLAAVIGRMRKAGFPYDTQWSDIDYMDAFKDFTYSNKTYPNLPEIVADLHAHGQHYIPITDPGISNQQPRGSYPPYDLLEKEKLYVKMADGINPIVGKVWPGWTVFPDFSHPVVQEIYWPGQLEKFHEKIPFDGLWLDMNEPSSGVDGSQQGCVANSSLDNPPYVPAVVGGALYSRTLCPSAIHYLTSHYNIHNLYGYMESRATYSGLVSVRGDHRPFVLSRSTFIGTGRFAAHWLGDNKATWTDMAFSIPGILRFGMFGVPLSGVDICGFGGTTTEELCIRWMQVGAFYPFTRNHNVIGKPDQDPAAPRFSAEARAAMKSAFLKRYLLLPHLYTLFYRSHVEGNTVATPLFFNYPEDRVTYTIDKQFMWGYSLLITPCLQQGAVEVSAYFPPQDTWYDLESGEAVLNTGEFVTIPAPLHHINVHVRGGFIVPTQAPAVTTNISRQNEFGLIVAFSAVEASDGNKMASGELFWDDGESVTSIASGTYNHILFEALSHAGIQSQVVKSQYKTPGGMLLGNVTVMGLDKSPSKVVVNNHTVNFNYSLRFKTLKLTGLKESLLNPLKIQWS